MIFGQLPLRSQLFLRNISGSRFLWPQVGRRPAMVFPKKHQWQPVSLATGGPQAGDGFFLRNISGSRFLWPQVGRRPAMVF
jgi:hypothetical protein